MTTPRISPKRALLVATAAVVLGGLLVGGLRWRQSDETRVRDRLHDLTQSLSYEPGTLEQAYRNRVDVELRAAVAGRVSVSVPEQAPAQLTVAELLSWALQTHGIADALRLRLEGVVVRVDTQHDRAQAVGDLMVSFELRQGGQKDQERRFAAGLVRRDSRWLIRTVTLTEPRHDEPEARP